MQLIEKWCFKLAVHLTIIPLEHPLFKLVRASTSQNVQRHRTPLHNLMSIFKLDPKEITKIDIAICNLLDANKLPLRISIANSKEESKAESLNAMKAIKVYSNGLKINGKVGTAALLLKPGQPAHTLQYHLGSDVEHTIQEAELVGLLLGAHLIKTEAKGRTSFALGTDNQAAIKTLRTDLRQSGQKIAINFLKTVESI
jgi:hypothetical protein